MGGSDDRRSRSVSCEEVAPNGDRGDRGDRGGDRGREERGNEPSKLFIGQLSFDAEESDIRDKFERYGEIVSVQIIKDNNTGKSKGFGFIKFKETEDAEKVLRTMDGAEIVGRRCKLDRAGAGGKGGGKRGGKSRDRDGYDRGRGRDDHRGGGRDDRGGGAKLSEPDKLFIGKLSLDASEDDVHDAFKSIGGISVQIIKDRENGESRGFGFIKFADSAAADEALRTMQGCDVAGQPCRLERAGQKGPGGGGGGRGGGGGGGGRDESASRSPSHRGDRRAVRDDRTRSPRAGRPHMRRVRSERGGEREHGGSGRHERRPGGGREEMDGYQRRPRGGRGERAERGERGEREPRGHRRRRAEYVDERHMDDRGQEREHHRRPRRGEREPREARSRTPDGLPRKSEAIHAAQRAFEDAFEAVQLARQDADAAEASLKKQQKAADHAVDRKVAEETDRIKADLEDKLGELRDDAKTRVADLVEDMELRLRQEMMDKISKLKEEYTNKIEDEKERLKTENEEATEDAERKAQEDADKQIRDLRRKVEEDENPYEWVEARDKAVNLLQKEEEKLQSTKRRLESLTGQPVKEPRIRPPPRAPEGGKRGPPPPPPQARRGAPPEPEDEEEEYSYSEEEVSEEEYVPEARKPQGRPPPPRGYSGRGGY
eukprot:TRINITY_DN48036_c0_g1_i1.p1 TRINITY_DN48036_c0_g1~~TRINITY_DN48036_c0_g1_i1.p1  ORF type:complete len:673 (+),score=148.05 TRINITY_DN48036_c0_g1_i1:48-2021(+)